MTCECSKVLLVDDEPYNIFILKKYLDKANLKADTALNGKAAINSLLKRKEACTICGKYRIVFMDINMPIMNGIEAMKEIRRLIENNELPKVPVLAITAAVQSTDKETVASYRRYGFNEYCRVAACARGILLSRSLRAGNTVELHTLRLSTAECSLRAGYAVESRLTRGVL